MPYFWRSLFIIALFGGKPVFSAQHQSNIDSLKKVLQTTIHDTTRIKTMKALAWNFKSINLDSSMLIIRKTLPLTDKLKRKHPSQTKQAKKYKAELYNYLGEFYRLKGRYLKALEYYEKSISLHRGLDNLVGVAGNLNDIGNVYSDQNKFSEALRNYLEALDIYRQLGRKEKTGGIYINIGVLYSYQNEFDKALMSFKNALRIFEELNDLYKVKFCSRNIGLLYSDQKKYDKALAYFQKVLKMDRQQNDKVGIAAGLGYIGAIYRDQNKYVKSIKFNSESFHLFKELNMDKAAARELSDISKVYFDLFNDYAPDSVVFQIIPEHPSFNRQELLDSALAVQKRALKTFKDLQVSQLITESYRMIGNIHQGRHNYREALRYFNKAYALARQSANFPGQRRAAKELFQTYKKVGNYNKALHWHERLLAHKDSLFNKSKQKELGRLEARFKWKQKELKDSLEHVKEMRTQKLKHRHQMQQQRTYTYAGIGGFVLMLALALLLYRSYRQKQRSNQKLARKNKVINQQKKEVDQKNKEIVSSITYAQSLQEAIFPSPKKMNRLFPEYFVQLRPQEKVSGDFYWVEKVNEKIYFSVIDCTGHGVPGAMVSVVGNEALNRCLREFKLRQPKAILDKLTQLIEEYFENSAHKVKDGMDLGLCCWDRGQKTLTFAGANNPAYIITTHSKKLKNKKKYRFWPVNKNNSKRLVEIKGDPQPIGKFSAQKPFQQHRIKLNKNDKVYLFTDGYPDQFGGPKGKKFMYKRFRELLLNIQNQPMEQQKQLLDKTIEEWMAQNNEKQIDDICILGVRV